MTTGKTSSTADLRKSGLADGQDKTAAFKKESGAPGLHEGQQSMPSSIYPRPFERSLLKGR